MARKLSVLLVGLVVVVAVLALYRSQLQATTQSKSVDLNMDGNADTVTLEYGKDDGSFTLRINDAKITGRLDEYISGFTIVDIDANDKRKEVEVATDGPSDDPECIIYAYDGKKISQVASLEGYRTYSGTGFVYTKVHCMCFWTRTDKYSLNEKTHKLDCVLPELYAVMTTNDKGDAVPVSCTVKKTFPLYRSRDGKDVLANVAPKSTISLLACDMSPVAKDVKGETNDDDCDWYLIQSATGLLGWARLSAIMDNVEDLPLAD